MLVYALDIGGSSVKHAVIDTDQRLGAFRRSYEPLRLQSRVFEELKANVIGGVRTALLTDPMIDTVAISTAGSVDKHGVVLSAGNFDGYVNVSWDAILHGAIAHVPRVVTVSDGRAATWAEFMGQSEVEDVDNFAHFVVGTGIGGATVVDKKLVTGSSGFAGHLGHLRVTERETVTCSCGKTGCVETVASAPAIVRYYKARQTSSGNQQDITLQDVVTAARGGDKVAHEAFTVAGTYLGIAASYIINLQNPSVITIGGGAILAASEVTPSDRGNVFLEALVASAHKYANRRVVATTSMHEARFGNDGGMIGAALLARSMIESD